VYAAVLDADVLVPSALCDTLLRLAADGFCRPLWSLQILKEVEHAIVRVRPDLQPARAARRTDVMRGTFLDANVERWEEVAAGLDSSMLEVLVRQAADLSNPPMDLAGRLNNLARCNVPNFVEAARRLAPQSM
jgi:hypothetical protein